MVSGLWMRFQELEGVTMVVLHVEYNDSGKDPKKPRMRNKLANSNNLVEKMKTSLCNHNEKDKYLEEEMIHMF
jgi:hypothetical protein